MDFRIINDSSVCLVHFDTTDAKNWRNAHVPFDNVNPRGANVVYCSPRHIEELTLGMLQDGLMGTVDGEPVKIGKDDIVVIDRQNVSHQKFSGLS